MYFIKFELLIVLIRYVTINDIDASNKNVCIISKFVFGLKIVLIRLKIIRFTGLKKLYLKRVILLIKDIFHMSCFSGFTYYISK